MQGCIDDIHKAIDAIEAAARAEAFEARAKLAQVETAMNEVGMFSIASFYAII